MDEQFKFFYPLHLISLSDVPPLTHLFYSYLNPPRYSIYRLNQPPSPPDIIYSNSIPLDIQWCVIGPPDIQLKVHSNLPDTIYCNNPHTQSFHKNNFNRSILSSYDIICLNIIKLHSYQPGLQPETSGVHLTLTFVFKVLFLFLTTPGRRWRGLL